MAKSIRAFPSRGRLTCLAIFLSAATLSSTPARADCFSEFMWCNNSCTGPLSAFGMTGGMNGGMIAGLSLGSCHSSCQEKQRVCQANSAPSRGRSVESRPATLSAMEKAAQADSRHDYSSEIYWLKKSYQEGDTDVVPALLYEIYTLGRPGTSTEPRKGYRPTASNDREGMKWLTIGVKARDERSLFDWAMLNMILGNEDVRSHRDTAEEDEQTIKGFTLSAEKGDAWAALFLAGIYSGKPPRFKANPAESERYMEMAERLGIKDARKVAEGP